MHGGGVAGWVGPTTPAAFLLLFGGVDGAGEAFGGVLGS